MFMKNPLHSSLKDEELVRLFVSTGKQTYFEMLYHRYYQKVYRQCLLLINDPHLAQDYTHDIFMRVMLKLNNFQGRSLFTTWLYAISRNYCISRMRNMESISHIPLDEMLECMHEECSEPTEHKLNLLQDALSLLTSEEATILTMKYNEELELTQIGEQLTLSIGAVKMRLKRSREKLRKHMLRIDL